MFVDLDHGTRHRRNQIAGGLDALDCAELLAGNHIVAGLWHVDIHHIAKLMLGVVRYAYVTDIAVDADISWVWE